MDSGVYPPLPLRLRFPIVVRTAWSKRANDAVVGRGRDASPPLPGAWTAGATERGPSPRGRLRASRNGDRAPEGDRGPPAAPPPTAVLSPAASVYATEAPGVPGAPRTPSSPPKTRAWFDAFL